MGLYKTRFYASVNELLYSQQNITKQRKCQKLRIVKQKGEIAVKSSII